MADKRTGTQSAELAGGAGFVYEANVAAHYLTALLTEGSGEGLLHRIVKRVALQQKSSGEPLDDVIVDASGADEARLSLQVKRQLTISSAATNDDFREIVLNSWRTLQKPDFRENVDRYGAATGTISADRLRELRRVCEIARSSLSAESFFTRGSEQGNAGQDFNATIAHFRTILVDKGVDFTEEDLYRLLRHFVVIQFDFLTEESTHPTQAIEKLRAFLPGESQRAPDLWQRLVGIARDGAGKSAEYDRAALVAQLSADYQLAPAPSIRADLETLEKYSAQGIESIVPDIAGAHVDRSRLRESALQELKDHRFVQIRGLPGTGKSVLLRDLATDHRTTGNALFLKSDRLKGSSWTEFAAALGLSVRDLQPLLTDLAASGPPILFLDGIDRIAGAQRNVVIDLLNAIFAPTGSRWKVVATLRDTGVEPLRNWLPRAVVESGLGSIAVPAFDDVEAETLSSQQPALRPLLLGAPKVREIARRPFFASVLARVASHATAGVAFVPQSEADLIKEWWRRGGYSAEEDTVLPRKRTLLELATKSANRPGLNVSLSDLTPETVAQLPALIDDGIIQVVNDDDRYRFSHDIFFEWSFYRALKDQSESWIATLTAAGEPPVLGRVVELLAQSNFAAGTWASGLAALEASTLRAQWRRAWLLGPLASPDFGDHQAAFEAVVSANGYKHLNQLMVWFQAERTTPNPLVLQGHALTLAGPEMIQLADQLGWPSDASAWRRFIDWVLDREDQLPSALIPTLVSVLEVWQNAFSMYANPVSQRILDKALEWLIDIENRSHAEGWPHDLGRWNGLSRDVLGQLESSLRVLVLTGAIGHPAESERYLKRLVVSKRYRRHAFNDVLIYSTVLARTLPDALAELFREEVLALLPKDQLVKWEEDRQEELRALERRRALPEAQRARLERFPMVSGIRPSLSDRGWEELSIREHRGNYFPASPLREPFASLFEHASDQALALVRAVHNHAINAWRQLHQYTNDGRGTPLPLELDFPWGRQVFWGDHSQYEWFRGRHGHYLVSSALMALEQWAFDEISKERPVDDVISDAIQGHEGWAVLGIAAALCLETQQVSPVSAALVGCQRLWKTDLSRQLQDQGSNSNLIGFGGMLGEKKSDRRHFDAVKAGNQRRCRQWSVRDLTPSHVLAGNEAVRSATIKAIAGFPDQLPFAYEEEAQDAEHVADLRTTAEIWAEWGKPENYKARKLEGDDSQVVVELDNPRTQAPDVQATLARTTASMQSHGLWAWVARCFETGDLVNGLTVESAVHAAQAIDHPALFSSQQLELDVTEGAVAGVAAVVKCFMAEPDPALLTWADKVIARAILMPTPAVDPWAARAVVPWHSGIYVAHAAAGDIRHGRDATTAKSVLYQLCGHPLESVSLAAFGAALSCWGQDDRFAWIAVDLGVRLAEGTRRAEGASETDHASQKAAKTRQAVLEAQSAYQQGSLYPDLSLPPAPWVERLGEDPEYPATSRTSNARWQHSETYWLTEFAGKVLEDVPLDKIYENPARHLQYLRFMDGLLDWSIESLSPSWEDDTDGTDDRAMRRSNLGTWIADYARMMAGIASNLGAQETISRYLQRVVSLDDELCASFLNPFVSRLIVTAMDAKAIPAGTFEVLMACTDRLLADTAFRRRRDRDPLHGFDLPYLVRNLFFVGVEANGAARFANGDWTDIAVILPITDKLMRAAGWAPSVMDNFLTLCERAGGCYPTELLADQVLAVLASGDLPGWRNTSLPSRIAGLVQAHADRGAPLNVNLSRKLLQILDFLVDMGDRRSAALQISDAFKDVRVPAPGNPETSGV